MIAALEQRLHEPLRLAIAGMVKAGKSTLLNAMLGEQIAPTDAGECTRVVTWYRYSDDADHHACIRTTANRGGCRCAASDGRLVLDLGGMQAEDVEWIDVGWPLERPASR